MSEPSAASVYTLEKDTLKNFSGQCLNISGLIERYQVTFNKMERKNGGIFIMKYLGGDSNLVETFIV